MEDQVDQAGREFPPACVGGRLDRPPELLGGHRPDVLLVFGDCATKPVVRRQSIVEIGPQREEHRHEPVVTRGVQQVVKEGGPFGFVARKGEELLELVDDEQHSSARSTRVETSASPQVERPTVGRQVVDEHGGFPWRGAHAARGLLAGEGERERLERMRRRREGLDRQVRVFLCADGGHDPGADERALAAPRRADDCNERTGADSRDELGRQLLATEKEPSVGLVEVLQALERRIARGRRLVAALIVRRAGKSTGRPSARTWYNSTGWRTSFSR